jgi:hypothetical protein
MSLITLNEYPIMSAEIRMPRVGVCNGDIVIDTIDEISGPVTIKTDDGKFSLKGTAFRAGQFTDHVRVRFVAGSGGLNNKIAPKAFDGYTVQSILSDILAKCGETLSATADKTLLSLFIQKWVRLGSTGKEAVNAILEDVKAEGWRILPDGTFYATSKELWPAVSDNQFDLIHWNRSEGWADIGSEQPFMFPGQVVTLDDVSTNDTVGAQKISYVVHRINPTKIRSQIFFENAS